MKCLKNRTTKEIVRVDDVQAEKYAKSGWDFVKKSEWKEGRPREDMDSAAEREKKQETISEKALRRSKIKSKQRQPFMSDAAMA